MPQKSACLAVQSTLQCVTDKIVYMHEGRFRIFLFVIYLLTLSSVSVTSFIFTVINNSHFSQELCLPPVKSRHPGCITRCRSPAKIYFKIKD